MPKVSRRGGNSGKPKAGQSNARELRVACRVFFNGQITRHNRVIGVVLIDRLAESTEPNRCSLSLRTCVSDASRARLDELQRIRVNDVVNVSDTPNQLTSDDGPFRSVTGFDIEDRILLPTKTAFDTIDAIHTALCADGGSAYVHCDPAISASVRNQS